MIVSATQKSFSTLKSVSHAPLAAALTNLIQHQITVIAPSAFPPLQLLDRRLDKRIGISNVGNRDRGAVLAREGGLLRPHVVHPSLLIAPSKRAYVPAQYDLSATTYSPDGKVFQTDYAQKAVDNSRCAARADGAKHACLHGSSTPLAQPLWSHHLRALPAAHPSLPSRPRGGAAPPLPAPRRARSTALGIKCKDGIVLVRVAQRQARQPGTVGRCVAGQHARRAPGQQSTRCVPGRAVASAASPAAAPQPARRRSGRLGPRAASRPAPRRKRTRDAHPRMTRRAGRGEARGVQAAGGAVEPQDPQRGPPRGHREHAARASE